MKNKLVITNYKNCIGNFLFSEEGLEQLYLGTRDNVVGNIYVGKVKNIVKNINAAFVEYQSGKMAFLSLGNEPTKSIKEGDEFPIQIKKAAVKTKDPVATKDLSISGLYCVISITKGKELIQYSKKMNHTEKIAIQEYLQQYIDNIPDKFGIVIRTSVVELTDYQILLDEILHLCSVMDSVITNAKHRTCYSLLYHDTNEYLKQLTKIPATKYDEIVTDLAEIYDELSGCTLTKSLRFYDDKSYSLAKLYSIETKMNEILSKQVHLRSGGNIVIENTEAMTVIDVNTGKNIKKKNPDLLAFETNKEAAKEAAKQLILRNISGIIIVDFINMSSQEYQEQLITYLKSLLKNDPIQCNYVDMTALGLVELTRHKISPPIWELI